jgi:hypothetical protein
MGKGLSRQQCAMLGLAVAVSRHHHGQPVACVARPHASWRIPIVAGFPPDLNVRIAMHILGGIVVRPGNLAGTGGYLETTPQALKVRSSFSRALASLHRRGHLVEATEDGRFFDGYCLTESGLALGLPHEMTVPELGFRLRALALHGDHVTADIPPPDLAG